MAGRKVLVKAGSKASLSEDLSVPASAARLAGYLVDRLDGTKDAESDGPLVGMWAARLVLLSVECWVGTRALRWVDELDVSLVVNWAYVWVSRMVAQKVVYLDSWLDEMWAGRKGEMWAGC
jgi:hypothetical protein